MPLEVHVGQLIGDVNLHAFAPSPCGWLTRDSGEQLGMRKSFQPEFKKCLGSKGPCFVRTKGTWFMMGFGRSGWWLDLVNFKGLPKLCDSMILSSLFWLHLCSVNMFRRCSYLYQCHMIRHHSVQLFWISERSGQLMPFSTVFWIYFYEGYTKSKASYSITLAHERWWHSSWR